MKQNDIVIVLAAFAAYLILMVVVGAVYMKKTKNSEDYFLGGRGLSGWVAALSAQASDMSGWLLMDCREPFMHLEPVRHGLLSVCF